MRNNWPKREVIWFEDNTAFVSVPFTWLLPRVYDQCVSLQMEGYKVRAGGPAVDLLPDYLKDVAKVGGHLAALPHHNPQATFTTRGCIRRCEYCAVPRIEGDFQELPTWEPKPLVCDNNLLASSRRHFERVIDSLRPLRGIDFNQGLDARLLRDYHAEGIAELHYDLVRLSWDHVNDERFVMQAIELLSRHGIGRSHIRVYVLIGFQDTPEDARYRLETLKAMGIRPNVQRYQPLNALEKNSYIAPGWSRTLLFRFNKYWNRQAWYHSVPFDEFGLPRHQAMPTLH